MAYLTYIRCKKCGKNSQVAVNSRMLTPDLCYECTEKEEGKKRREYFFGLDGLTIEERLRKIEEWIYDYRPYREPRF
jgi:hypothetical protein